MFPKDFALFMFVPPALQMIFKALHEILSVHFLFPLMPLPHTHHILKPFLILILKLPKLDMLSNTSLFACDGNSLTRMFSCSWLPYYQEFLRPNLRLNYSGKIGKISTLLQTSNWADVLPLSSHRFLCLPLSQHSWHCVVITFPMCLLH